MSDTTKVTYGTPVGGDFIHFAHVHNKDEEIYYVNGEVVSKEAFDSVMDETTTTSND